MKPLTKSQETQIHKLFSLKAEVEGFVMDRVEYIIEKIAATFDSEVKWWSFPCSSEYHSMGNFYDAYNDDCFQFEGEFKRSDWCIILDDGEEYDLNNEFPTRWLYEEFEEELINGKKELEQKLAKQKEDKVKKTLLKNSAKKKLLESAKSKLTEEERKALGL